MLHIFSNLKSNKSPLPSYSYRCWCMVISHYLYHPMLTNLLNAIITCLKMYSPKCGLLEFLADLTKHVLSLQCTHELMILLCFLSVQPSMRMLHSYFSHSACNFANHCQHSHELVSKEALTTNIDLAAYNLDVPMASLIKSNSGRLNAWNGFQAKIAPFDT